ncbi:MAG: hypothetical protein ACE5DM_01140 [Candidatus Nanoarchaeia archaeon]
MKRIILILLLLTLVSQAFADEDFVLVIDKTWDSGFDGVQSISISVNDYNNEYYGPGYVNILHDTPVYSEDVIVALDEEGHIVMSDLVSQLDKQLIGLVDPASISRIEIRRDGVPYLQRTLTFCNNNNVCEPCEGPACDVIESSLTCSDCKSGSADGYCDLVIDKRCDPDCGGVEADCDGCDPYCYFEGMDTPVFCEEQGGIICAEGKECLGNRIDVKSWDAEGGERCCVGEGVFCADTGGLDVPQSVFDEAYGSDLQSFDEWWDAMEADRRKAGVPFDGETLSEKEFVGWMELNGQDPVLEAAVMSDEDWNRMVEETESHPSGYVEAPTIKDIVAEKIEASRETLPEDAAPLFTTFLAIVVVMTLALFVLLFMHGANKQVVLEASVSGMLKEIGRLKKRGYSMDQIRTFLLNRGYDVIQVNNEITKMKQQVDYGKR